MFSNIQKLWKEKNLKIQYQSTSTFKKKNTNSNIQPKTKNQYPAYALKSDDSQHMNPTSLRKQNQYPAYALKSDDGNPTNPIS